MSKNDTYAVISTGGKQYRVAEGDTIHVELLDHEPGKKITFEDVLLVQDGGKTLVGTPKVDGASVTGAVEGRIRGEKVIVFKKKRRKGYEKTQGHRQDYLSVTIEKISASAGTKAEKKAEAKTEKKTGTKAKAKSAPAKSASKTKAASTKAASKKSAPAKSAPKKKTAAKKSAPAKKKTTAKSAPKKKADKE
jgi:large subunit ribosomal protein L21